MALLLLTGNFDMLEDNFLCVFELALEAARGDMLAPYLSFSEYLGGTLEVGAVGKCE